MKKSGHRALNCVMRRAASQGFGGFVLGLVLSLDTTLFYDSHGKGPFPLITRSRKGGGRCLFCRRTCAAPARRFARQLPSC